MSRTHTRTDSPLGPLTVVADDGAVVAVYFDDHVRRPSDVSLGVSDARGLSEVAAQLEEYFAGTRRVFDITVSPAGTPFQRRVWERVAAVPYGTTTTYAAIAAELGDRRLTRAVGHANGRNPLCIVVGCHRVVGATGRLTGYAGGLTRKQYLLDLERSVVQSHRPVPV